MKHLHAFLSALVILTLMTAAFARAEDPATKVQEGCTVLVIEPSRWVGGILGAGIKPMQDCAEPKAVGGLTASRVFIDASYEGDVMAAAGVK